MMKSMSLKANYDVPKTFLGQYFMIEDLMQKTKPWISGLIDGLSGSNLIRSSTISHKNRIAFIILDSTLEITFKNYLVNEKRINTIPKEKWKHREEIVKIVKNKVTFEKEIWDAIDYFYGLRIGLYHEDAEKTVTDGTVGDFQELVEFVIDTLFGIKCSEATPLSESLLPTKDVESDKIPVNRIPEKINVVVVAVAESESKNPQEINDFLRKKGFRGKISNSTICIYLNHTFSYLFHKEDSIWKLSDEGKNRYEELRSLYLPQIKKEDPDGTRT